jgi:hypothetical protein
MDGMLMMQKKRHNMIYNITEKVRRFVGETALSHAILFYVAEALICYYLNLIFHFLSMHRYVRK